jgi:hypothetical protein
VSSTNKRSPGTRGIPQPFNREAGYTPQIKPGVAQQKTAMSAQSGKRPVAPPVYRPQAMPNAAQPKMASGAVIREVPVAPPVYRPPQVPKVLQTKSSSAHSPLRSAAQSRPSPLTRHVSGARPNVLQMKCNCNKKGRSSNKHLSSCPEHPNNKKAKAEKVKAVKQDSKSIMNFYAYDSQWAKANNITDKMVKDFVKEKGEIHGHATSRADKDAKRHANTDNDLKRFHEWYEANKNDY